jgi:hypothetical protein
MKYGDLSSRISPRLLLVAEGALIGLADDKQYDKWVARNRWDKAMDCWFINEMMARQILYLYWKKDINIELVTFVSEEFCRELRQRMDREQLPVSNVWYTTPTLLARRIAYMPDLAYVYDPDPDRWLLYGSKGRYIQKETQLGG